MRVQVLFLGFQLLLPMVSHADTPPAQGCFNFAQKITAPLHERIALGTSKSGKIAENRYWGATRSEIPVSTSLILKDLLDHNSTKGGRISKMRVTPLEDTNFLARQVVRFEVDPFPFVTVTWEENWGFSLLKGSAGDPESVLASYEKTSGTSHITHLCGSIWIEKMGPSSTDFYIYEEAEATGRTQEDTLKGIQGTVKALSKLKANVSPKS